MRAFEITAAVHDRRRISAELPEAVDSDQVRLIVLLPAPEPPVFDYPPPARPEQGIAPHAPAEKPANAARQPVFGATSLNTSGHRFNREIPNG